VAVPDKPFTFSWTLSLIIVWLKFALMTFQNLIEAFSLMILFLDIVLVMLDDPLV
jgi:hypothetical protein